MNRLARARARELARLDLAGYVLKKDSPSCGMARVRVHGQGVRPLRRGTGLFARALMEHLPLLPVEEEGLLRDPRLRENFVERAFAYARWKDTLAAGLTRSRLVTFHATHKLLIMAHDPAAYRRLGALVANARQRPLRAVATDYGAVFMQALRARATPRRHANVLEHVLGYFSDRLTSGTTSTGSGSRTGRGRRTSTRMRRS